MKIENLETIKESHLPILREYFDVSKNKWDLPYYWQK